MNHNTLSVSLFLLRKNRVVHKRSSEWTLSHSNSLRRAYFNGNLKQKCWGDFKKKFSALRFSACTYGFSSAVRAETRLLWEGIWGDLLDSHGSDLYLSLPFQYTQRVPLHSHTLRRRRSRHIRPTVSFSVVLPRYLKASLSLYRRKMYRRDIEVILEAVVCSFVQPARLYKVLSPTVQSWHSF